jgi:dipeptidyl-peptidase 4
MRTFAALLMFVAALPAMAARLTIDRMFDDPALSGPQARGVEVAPDGERVTFLKGRADDQFRLDLWQFDLKTGATRLLVDSKQLVPDEQLSDAEKARRERERTALYHGILSYSWSPDGKHLLFPLGGELYLYDLDADADHAVRQLTHGGGDVLDPKVSPRGRYVSFVRGQNLHVIDLQTGVERGLTHDGGGTVHEAEAEFIAQEEFDQPSGYWWAPDDSLIAFKRFDEANVPIAKRFEVYADRTEVVEQRYPHAGEANAVVQFGLVAPDGSSAPRWIDTGANTDIYLPRLNWLPDARHLAYQRLSRDQKTLELLEVDTGSLKQTPLVTEHSATWINLNDDLRFLKRQPAFVWASERSGYKHFYLYGLDGKLIRPLTAGDWQIDKLLAVDESAGLVYFASNKDSIPEQQIYTVPLDNDAGAASAAAPRRISQDKGWHDPTFGCDEEAAAQCKVSLYVDTWSDAVTPPQTSVRGADGKLQAWIEHNEVDEHHPWAAYRADLAVPEFGTLPAADGQALGWRMVRPPHFDPAKRYPVVLYLYGGPTEQLATDAWEEKMQWSQYLAQQGTIVFTLDNRGTARRGRRYSDPIKNQFGAVEVQDQLTGIRWLKQQPWVDGARIGVFGWSFGGYMSVMMLAKASDQLAAGVAVAPVTDWRIYDTGYTERYLGTPQDNPAGYEASAVFKWLPGLRSPLFLAHGMADDNVLFTNSTRLMAALQTQGTQFRLMTYPGGKHGLSTPAMLKHLLHAVDDFYKEKLGGGQEESKPQ